MEEKTAKQVSLEQEERIAKLFNANRTPRSGGGAWKKGDALSDRWFLECKTTVKPSLSYSVNKTVVDKMDHERAEMHKPFAALAFTLGEQRDDYFVLDKRTMKSILDVISDIDKLKELCAIKIGELNDKRRELQQAQEANATTEALYKAHKEELEQFIQELEKII